MVSSTCTIINVLVRMYVRMHACMHVLTYVRTYVCMYVCMYVCKVCKYVSRHLAISEVPFKTSQRCLTDLKKFVLRWLETVS